MMRTRLHEEKGVILPLVLILTLILMITGFVFVSLPVQENRLVRREIIKRQAFYLAEAGLERTLYELKQDFNNSQSWTDRDINGIAVELPDSNNPDTFYLLPLPSSTLGDGGEYSTWLKYVFTGEKAERDEIWVKSTGTSKNISKTVQTYVKVAVDSLWNNAVSAGGGAEGAAITGNVSFHGSVHIFGAGLGPTEVAMGMTGAAGIFNNYEGMSSTLLEKTPPCPETTFNGETVQSLEATLRVKHGQVSLSGGATIGEEDVSGNYLKETMDGVYVTDGFTNGGADQVHSDNGADNPYDLGDSTSFPSLTDYYPGYDDYLDYLANNSLHITINEISSNIVSFVYGDYGNPEAHYIKWDQASRLLEINGTIYIDGGALDLGKERERIEYSGMGTIVVAEEDELGNIGGEIRVHGDLLAQGTYEGGEGFPNNVLGLITYDLGLATGLGDADSIMTGAFYAEHKITSAKQNEIAGAFLSSGFDMGTNVPSIYEVPVLGDSLQTEMLNLGAPRWIVTTSQWEEK